MQVAVGGAWTLTHVSGRKSTSYILFGTREIYHRFLPVVLLFHVPQHTESLLFAAPYSFLLTRILPANSYLHMAKESPTGQKKNKDLLIQGLDSSETNS